MIAENKKRNLLATIEQTKDEAAFAKIEAFVNELLAPAKRKAGFLQGSVIYQDENWDAPLPDDTWVYNQPLQ